MDNGNSTSNGGIFRWTMDALFGSGISPSKKYKQQVHSQDDTNYRRQQKQYGDDRFEPQSMGRSNSLDGLDLSFYRRYDLLPPEGEPSLLSPVQLQADPTNTFAHKNQQKPTYKSPMKDDPILNKLFNKYSEDTQKINNLINDNIPGKFPSPQKHTVPDQYSDTDYHELFEELYKNNSLLQNLSDDIDKINEFNNKKENYYKSKYDEIRLELIHELRQSKKLSDNYFTLYSKYQELKRLHSDFMKLKQQLNIIESENYNNSINNDTEIDRLQKKLLTLELKCNEINIQKDEEKIRSQELMKTVSALEQENKRQKLKYETEIMHLRRLVDSNNGIGNKDINMDIHSNYNYI